MRKGEKWYYKSCELIQKFLGNDSVYYRGFQYINVNNVNHLVGIFETVDSNINLDSFQKRYRNYHNKECGIVGITCHKVLGTYRNCIVVHLD